MGLPKGLVWVCCILLVGFRLYGQSAGCTDPQALNFVPTASVNDGSCLYPLTSYVPAFLGTLSDAVRETSGLGLLGGTLLTHNDSGHPPRLYTLDTLSGQIIRQIHVGNAPNIDWESLAQSPTHLFVGDFGNNQGSRQDLRILRIPLDALVEGGPDTVMADVIAFHYPDQTIFSPAGNNHEFDAEGFFYRDGLLHLFTKNWVSQTTRYYTIPAEPGAHAAVLQDSFDCGGLITGAAIQPDGDAVVLVGYRNIGFGIYTCFAWLLFDYPEGQPLRGNRRRIELGSALQMGQLEAVWLQPDFSGWMTGEAIQSGPIALGARLHRFDFSGFISEGPVSKDAYNREAGRIQVYPNPGGEVCFVDSPPEYEGLDWMLVDLSGQVWMTGYLNAGLMALDTQLLPGGRYFLVFGQAALPPVPVQVVH